MRSSGLPTFVCAAITYGITITLFASSFALAAGQGPGQKFNPGHYISMNSWDEQKDIIRALRPGVIGVQKSYNWKELEPSWNNYNFAEIRSDLDVLAAQGKQMVVFVKDKSFDSDNPVPGYLQADRSLPNLRNGYTAIRWNPYVVKRFSALLTELGREFDSHPAFEGVAIQESAHGIPNDVAKAAGYTPEKYRDALITVLTAAGEAMPTSQVFWYMNFLPGKTSYIKDVARAVAPLGVSVGGPDVLPDDYALDRLTYPLYDDLQGEVLLFNSVQYNSYSHIHKDKSYGTKYWTMDELFGFARDTLHVQYFFWNRKLMPEPEDAYDWNDALLVIAANPSFNGGGASANSPGSDNDADGLTYAQESAIGTDPDMKDTDGDTLADGVEYLVFSTDPKARDTDNDGIDDGLEIQYGLSNPFVTDTDSDGLKDGAEILIYKTDARNGDTDGDRLGDGAEVNSYGTDPLHRNTDRDGLSDRVEVLYKGTNPLVADTDGDGLTDGQEAAISGLGTDPLKADTDGGGVPDGIEVSRGTNPKQPWDD